MKRTVGRLRLNLLTSESSEHRFHTEGGAVCRVRGDPVDLDRRFTVEITVNGYVAHVIGADVYVHELTEQSLGDGFYGFSVSLDSRAVNSGAVVAARLANIGTAVGQAIVLRKLPPSPDRVRGPGAVRWLGNLRYSGWVSAEQDPAAIDVTVDGTLIDWIRIGKWSHVGSGEDTRAVGFDIFLPSRFGDGGVHQLAVVTTRGEYHRAARSFFWLLLKGSAPSSVRNTILIRKACGQSC